MNRVANTDPSVVRRRARRETLLIAAPFAIGVLLNAVVRPLIAGAIGATELRSGASVRGSDRWWIADPGAAAAHPFLAAFLRVSDGAIGVAVLLTCAVIAVTIWARGRRRAAAERRAAAAALGS